MIAFPNSSPHTRSGLGALLWGSGGSCKAVAGTLVAELDDQDIPQPARELRALRAPSAATGTTSGEIVIGGAGRDSPEAILEGQANGSFKALATGNGPSATMAADSASLGDAAIVSLVRSTRGSVIALRIQRHYMQRLSPPTLLPAGDRAVTALAVNLDFRSDALVAWASGGAVYAEEVKQTGTVEPAQKLGYSAHRPDIQPLISDDGHAMVAWESTEQEPPGGSLTRIRMSISGPNVRFGLSRLVEQFSNVSGVTPGPGSIRLTRLSTESVAMAWTGMSAGRYVVRASPVSLASGPFAPMVVSPEGSDAMLSDFVAGPRGEVLALWTSAPRLATGGFDTHRQQIIVSRGEFGSDGAMSFDGVELVSGSGSNRSPAAAFDPGTDRALAAWVNSDGPSRIVYSVRASGDSPERSLMR